MKNRYYGKVRVTDTSGNAIIDFTTVKTKKAKGKGFFVAAVLEAISTVAKSAGLNGVQKYNVDYQGDCDTLVFEYLIRSGLEDMGVTKGKLEGV